MSAHTAATGAGTKPPLFLVKGDATPEEVAVLHGMADAAVPGEQPAPGWEWAASHRQLRRPNFARPAGWRGSAFPTG